MRRTRKGLWLLLLWQIVPLLLAIVGISGLLDPLGTFIIQSIPLPGPGERPGFLINAARFITGHWFLYTLWLMGISWLVAVVYVAFDSALTKLERLAWAISFVFGQSVTVILYCVLGLLALRSQYHASGA